MDLAALAAALKASPVSEAIQSHLWVVPTVQSIHILAIAILFASALFLNLRILGLVGSDEPVVSFARRYVPWIWSALIVLALTGLTMVVGEPDRTLTNWVFWTKMSLVAGAVALSAGLHLPMAANPYAWDRGRRRGLAALLAGVSMLLWVAIIVCGRWIAYVL